MPNFTKPNVILMTDVSENMSLIKPLGVQKVAHVLRESGYEVIVINHLSVFSYQEICHLLSNLITDQTLFVGINNFEYKQYQPGPDKNLYAADAETGCFLPHGKQFNLPIRNLIKEKNPNCKIVAGGPNIIDTGHYADFDYLVLGYAEISVLDLCQHLEGKKALTKQYRSLHGPVVINDPTAQGYDFANSNLLYADSDAILDNELLSLEVGRGCIFNCLFCSFPLNGKKKFDYIRRKDLVYNELMENYNKFKVTRYMIVDDTFNDSVEKCQMILEISQMLPFKLEYWAYIRLDLLAAHPETIGMLLDSGCRAMFFGIETLNEIAAKAIRKGGSREKLIATIDKIKNLAPDKVNLLAAFILGLPGEDLASMQKTLDYLSSDSNRLDSWQVRPLSIRHPDCHGLTNNGVLSDIDLQYTKYGYENLGKDLTPGSNRMLWKNQYTDYLTVNNMSNQANVQYENSANKPIIGLLAFRLSGLNIPLDRLITVPRDKIDWYEIDRQKLLRSIEYKNLLFARLQITDHKAYYSTWSKDMIKFKTFSNYILSRLSRN
jgi:hypothetical protein